MITGRGALVGLAGCLAVASGSAGAQPAGSTPAPSLDQLLKQFDATAPQVEASVRIDAHVEHGADGRVVIITLAPEGVTKLIADPGITITPTTRPGVVWHLPLPHRHIDPTISYFSEPQTMRLPFDTSNPAPLEILVEYAYCVVDYQCFFGEETLEVATTQP